MLRISLRDLARTGSLRVRDRVLEDDPLWEGAELGLAGALDVDLVAETTATGQVLVRGTLRAPLAQECRRCLAQVDRSVDLSVAWFWAAPDEVSRELGDDGEIRLLEPGATELDLGGAVREELLLGSPTFALCRADCRGLCVRCGADLNTGPCGCVFEEPDPRWDALRALKNE